MGLFDDILRRAAQQRWVPTRIAALLPRPLAIPAQASAPLVEASVARLDAGHPPERVFSQPIQPAPAPIRAPVRDRTRTLADAPPAGEGWFRRLARRADSIVNTLSGLGGQYDKGTSGRPDLSRMPLSFQELTALYRWNGYAQRFIDIVPSDATRKGWKVVDSTDDADTMADENKRLHVNKRVHEALQWARLYGGCILLIVVDEDIPVGFANSPGALLAQPLDPARVRRVLNLIPLDPSEAQPYTYESDLRSQRFKEVRTWFVSPNTNAATALSGHQIVHHSRVIYFPGKRLPSVVRHTNRGIDDSVLEAIWDQIRNRTSVDQAAALIAQELKLNVLKIQGLSALSTSDQADLFEMRMKTLAKSKSLNNMVLIGDGEEFASLATPMSGFDQLDTNSREALCAVTGMPAELLFGDAPSGLNTDGESHTRLWGNVIAAWQNDRLRDELTYLYWLIFCSRDGPTSGVLPEKWDVKFLPLDELTETEQAALELQHAQADQIRVSAQILPAEHIARSRYGEAGYQNSIQPYDPDADAKILEEEIARLMADQEQARELGILPAPPAQPAGADVAGPVLDHVDTTQVAGLLPDAAVDAFAEKLTAAGVSRCEHGSANRCRICGIERVRDFETTPDGKPKLGKDGQPVWSVKWRPIYRPIEPVVTAAGTPVDAPRTDALDPGDPAAPNAAILIELPGRALNDWITARAAVEAVTGPLDFEGRPHCTLLYVGAVRGAVFAELCAKVGAACASVQAGPVVTGRVVAMPPGPRGGPTPVVLVLDVPGPTRTLHDALVVACGSMVSARQFPRYVPHVTLGYSAADPEALNAALAKMPVPVRIGWTPTDAIVTSGGATAWSARIGRGA